MEYLPALKASRGMRVRSELAAKFSAKYSNAPAVLAYYREAIQSAPNEFQPEDDILSDRVDPKVWGELFLEPLVQRCEQGKWDWAFSALRYRTGWKNRPAYVARISAALLKHHPILLRAVRQIPENELEPWARAVREAGAVGDLALVELLKPALEDRRQAPINLGAGGVNEGRVCDRALFAILNILDGDSFAAFKKAGVTDWNEKAFDRMIGVVKERLKTLQPPPTK